MAKDPLEKLHGTIRSRLSKDVEEELEGVTPDMARLGSLKSLAKNMMGMSSKEEKIGYITQSLMLLAATVIQTSEPEEFYVFTTDLMLILPNKEDKAIVRNVSAKVFKGMLIHASGTDIFSEVLEQMVDMVVGLDPEKDEARSQRMIREIKNAKKGGS